MQTSFWSPFLADLRALSDFGDGLSLYAIRLVRLTSMRESSRSRAGMVPIIVLSSFPFLEGCKCCRVKTGYSHLRR